MGLVPVRAGAGGLARGGLGGEHDLIHVALRAGEAAIDREGPGDVGGVAVELAARVDQQQVAVIEALIVFDVVQHAGVGAAGDDAGVGGRLAAGGAEGVQQLGFDLEFVAARAGGAHGAAMGVGGDLRGAAHGGEFRSVLDEAHLVELGAQVAHGVRRGEAAAGLVAHGVKCAEHARVPVVVVAEAGPQQGLVGEVVGQTFFEVADGPRLVEAEGLARGLGAPAVAVPDLAFFVLFAAEEDLLGLLAGDQHHDGFGFAEGGEVVEVAVVAVGVVGVAVAHALGRGGQDGDAAAGGLHALHEAGAAGAEGGGVDGGEARCVHGWNYVTGRERGQVGGEHEVGGVSGDSSDDVDRVRRGKCLAWKMASSGAWSLGFACGAGWSAAGRGGRVAGSGPAGSRLPALAQENHRAGVPQPVQSRARTSSRSSSARRSGVPTSIQRPAWCWPVTWPAVIAVRSRGASLAGVLSARSANRVGW